MITSGSTSGGGPSLHRRRGTKGRRGLGFFINLHPAIRNVIVALMMLVLVCIMVLITLFFQMTAVEKQTPVDSLRHKVQAVPNLLRGRQFHNNNNNNNNMLHNDQKLTPEEILRGGNRALVSNKDRSDAAPSSSNVADASSKVEDDSGYPYPLVVVPATYDIASQYQPGGGNRYPEYKTGEAPQYKITPELRRRSDEVARSRREFVKRAMQYAWKGYEKYAFGQDEVLPQSGRGNDSWGGQGITLVDSLDTLWLMGLKDEFWRGRDWVRDHLQHSRTGLVSVFETTIRDLGGLLAAYDFSRDETFLNHALDLGRRLIKAFDGAETGIPFGQVSLKDGTKKNIPWSMNNAIFAEFGTIQVENRYLSKMTQKPEFAQKTERVFEILKEISPPDGLFPYYFQNSFGGKAPASLERLKNGDPKPQFRDNTITFGAMADSTYEYMLKIWLQGGRKESEKWYRDMWDKAVDSMHNELLQYSKPSGLAYIADKIKSRGMDHKMDHLVCFMGGALALGAYTDPLGLQSERAQRDLRTGRALTYTCYQMYARMNTGISAEFVQFEEGRDFVIGRGAPHYLLRPEAFESFYILNHLTGDPIYREWGWECFQSIEKYCKTHIAYGSLPNVQDTNGKPRDKMESFFLAETLKYLYLLQDPDSEIDLLNKHVFNTEAHPLRIFPVIDAEGGAPTKSF